MNLIWSPHTYSLTVGKKRRMLIKYYPLESTFGNDWVLSLETSALWKNVQKKSFCGLLREINTSETVSGVSKFT